MMQNIFVQLAGKISRIVRHWWLYLVGGTVSIILGIILFCHPSESYAAISVILGAVVLLGGIISFIVAMGSRNLFMMRGYNLFGAFVDILIGIFLCAFPGVTAAVLPVLLGIWLMYHSFMLMGLAGDIRVFGAGGSGWVTVGGILMLLLSIFCLFNTFGTGMVLIVMLVAIALLVFGVVLIGSGLTLRKMNGYINDDIGPVDYGD